MAILLQLLWTNPNLSCSVAPFFPCFLVAAPLKRSSQKRVPFFSRVTEQLSNSGFVFCLGRFWASPRRCKPSSWSPGSGCRRSAAGWPCHHARVLGADAGRFGGPPESQAQNLDQQAVMCKVEAFRGPQTKRFGKIRSSWLTALSLIALQTGRRCLERQEPRKAQET